MNKWWKSIIIIACCAFSAVLMLYSLNEREKPAEPPAASPGASAPAAPAGSPAASPGASPAASPGASPAAPAAGVDEAAAMAIYKSSCLACHGDQLQGQMGPPLTNVGSAMTADQIHAQILNGGGGMPAFEGTLTDDQIQTLTNWLAAKK